MKYISKWWAIPKLTFISEFHEDEGYLESILKRSKEFNLSEYDHILFSFHSLTIRHISKLNIKDCSSNTCECKSNNRYCYKSNCIAKQKV